MLHRQAPVETHPLRLEAVPQPVPARGEVLVRVKACGICRTDLHVVEGDLPLRRDPTIPGHQIVGEIAGLGEGLSESDFRLGDRVGLAWLRQTCETCRFCLSGRENLCLAPEFNGYTHAGGFAEWTVAPASFAYRLPEGFDDLRAAPLLCAGIIGYRALVRCLESRPGEGLARCSGLRLGIYGFGAAGHVCIQLARAHGAEVFVCTRDAERHQALARELGATWVGGATDRPEVRLDAAILFAPAGELVPLALEAVDRGGTVVCGGIHMSDIPSFAYEKLYGEREVRSVMNNTREDGVAFLREAARIPVRTHVQTFAFERCNEALVALKHDALRGAGVLLVDA